MSTHPNQDLTTTAALKAAGWLRDEEADLLAVHLVEQGQATFTLIAEVDRGSIGHRLFLVPNFDAPAVEIAVSNCKPAEATSDAVKERIWFFGQLSHWQTRH